MKYALILISLIPLNILADDKFALVEDVGVFGEEESLEDSKNVAINEGKRIAIQKAIEQISGGKYFNISADYFDETIDSFSIKSETFVGNVYKAKVDYRVNISAVSNLLGIKSIEQLQPITNEYQGRLIAVNSSNISREYVKLCEILKQYSLSVIPYSFSSNKIKYKYSEQLNNILKESGADIYYETIH